VLVPSLSLLSQILGDWTFAASIPFDVLCVCSDKSVAKRGADEMYHSVSDVPFPVAAEVSAIKDFLRGSDYQVIFSTYQSSPLSHMPGGAFYVFPIITATGQSAKDLPQRLLESDGVAPIAGTSFGAHGEGYLRLSYANSLQNFEAALQRMRASIEAL